VSWRTILASIAAVLVTVIAIELVLSLQKILTWCVVAAFFAVVLNPPVDFLVYKAKLRRSLAALLVFLGGLACVIGMLYLLIRPIVDQGSKFADNFPHFVADAQAGRGPVGHLVTRYHLDRYVEQNLPKWKKALQASGKRAVSIAKRVSSTAAAVASVLVLTYLMLNEGPRVLAGGVGMLSPPVQKRLKLIGRDSAQAITGYMAGNVVISVIAAIVTFSGLWAFGVPFRTVMAVWVAFADLIPLIGATLGAVPTVAVAFLHSTTAGIGMIVIYVVYQQFENHVLQVGIMARTVRLSPLTVLVSLLAGVELFGLLGALLALPAAAIIQVVAKDVYRSRRSARPTLVPATDGTGIGGPDGTAPDGTGTTNEGKRGRAIAGPGEPG
jgi:predicted PurR-regulated permease PerM